MLINISIISNIFSIIETFCLALFLFIRFSILSLNKINSKVTTINVTLIDKLINICPFTKNPTINAKITI